MALRGSELPSKGTIDRAGQLLVDALRGAEVAEADLRAAELVVTDFRTAHSYPLTKVSMGLRSMITTEGALLAPSQRLKRTPRIIRKLRRMQDSEGHVSKLSRLEDVGGCRAVLASPDELQRVLRRIRRRWGDDIKRERDYISFPKPTGYQAVHIVVERDARRIEVQLRTARQQYWADEIERADARLNLTLKDGTGPREMIEFFAAGGEVLHAEEHGRPITPGMQERLQRARIAVVRAGFYSE